MVYRIIGGNSDRMGIYVRDPSAVLVVDPAGELTALRRGLANDDRSVTAVDSVDAALDRLGTDRFACVVVGDAQNPDRVAEAVAERGLDLPVLYAPTEGEDAAVGAMAAAGGRYLPPEVAEDRLVEIVGEAVDTYRDRYREREATSILETMLADLNVPLYAKDTEARHVMMSDVPGGPAPADVAGKTDAEVYNEIDAGDTTTDDQEVIEEGREIHRKVESHGQPPAEHWSRTTKVPWVDDDGTIRGLVGMSQDITDLKYKERELAEQNERLERFADYVSHDLKNPLQVAMGYVGVARGGEHDTELARAEDALDRMDEMLDDLRHTVRGDDVPESEGSPIVTLDDLVREVWESIETGDATLEVAFESPVTVVATHADLRPLFENLFKNAVEHGSTSPRSSSTHESSIEHGSTNGDATGLTVRVGPLPDGFYVADDGHGIPADEREEVLEEGYTTAETGTGTGLALVDEIADEHRWRLEIAASEADGAKFEFHNAPVASTGPNRTAGETTYDLDEAVDVGDVGMGDRGRYDADRDRWTIECDGRDIWRDINDFHYVFTRVTGDVRIEGRLVEMDCESGYAKAGLMVRDDTDEDSTYGYVGRTGEYGTELLWRARDGQDGRSQQLDEPEPFEYFRVDRVGEVVTCSVSAHGSTWRTVDRRPVALEDPVCVGLAVCSNVPLEPATAAFEGVTVTELTSE